MEPSLRSGKEPKLSSTSKVDQRQGLDGLADVVRKVAGHIKRREPIRLRMRE
jgi:hypothetical protein